MFGELGRGMGLVNPSSRPLKRRSEKFVAELRLFVTDLISDENHAFEAHPHGTIGRSITPSIRALPSVQEKVQSQFARAAANLLQPVVPSARLRAPKMVAAASGRVAGSGH